MNTQRRFPRKIKRVVIKVGSSLLANHMMKPHEAGLKSLVGQIAQLRECAARKRPGIVAQRVPPKHHFRKMRFDRPQPARRLSLQIVVAPAHGYGTSDSVHVAQYSSLPLAASAVPALFTKSTP